MIPLAARIDAHGMLLVSSRHSEWSAGIEAFLLRYVEWAGQRRAES